MRATLLIVLLGVVMGALLALTSASDDRGNEDSEFVSEEPLLGE